MERLWWRDLMCLSVHRVMLNKIYIVFLLSMFISYVYRCVYSFALATVVRCTSSLISNNLNGNHYSTSNRSQWFSDAGTLQYVLLYISSCISCFGEFIIFRNTYFALYIYLICFLKHFDNDRLCLFYIERHTLAKRWDICNKHQCALIFLQ